MASNAGEASKPIVGADRVRPAGRRTSDPVPTKTLGVNPNVSPRKSAAPALASAATTRAKFVPSSSTTRPLAGSRATGTTAAALGRSVQRPPAVSASRPTALSASVGGVTRPAGTAPRVAAARRPVAPSGTTTGTVASRTITPTARVRPVSSATTPSTTPGAATATPRMPVTVAALQVLVTQLRKKLKDLSAESPPSSVSNPEATGKSTPSPSGSDEKDKTIQDLTSRADAQAKELAIKEQDAAELVKAKEDLAELQEEHNRALASAADSLNGVLSEMEVLKTRKEELEREQKYQTEQSQSSSTELSNVKAQLAALQDSGDIDLQGMREEMRQLRDELAEARAKLSQSSTESEAMNSRLQSESSDVSRLTSELQIKTQDLQDLTDKIAASQAEADQLRAELQQLSISHDQMRKDLAAESLSKSQTSSEEHQESLNAITKQHSQDMELMAKEHLTSMDSLRESLTSSKSESQQELEAVQARLATSKSETDKAKNALIAAQSELEQMAEQAVNADAAIVEMRAHVASQETELIETRAQLEDSAKRVKEADEEIHTLQTHIQTQDQKIVDLSSDLNKFQEKNEPSANESKFQQELQDKETEIASSHELLEAIKNGHQSDMKNMTDVFASEMVDLKSQITDLQKANEELVLTNDRLNAEKESNTASYEKNLGSLHVAHVQKIAELEDILTNSASGLQQEFDLMNRISTPIKYNGSPAPSSSPYRGGGDDSLMSSTPMKNSLRDVSLTPVPNSAKVNSNATNLDSPSPLSMKAALSGNEPASVNQNTPIKVKGEEPDY